MRKPRSVFRRGISIPLRCGQTRIPGPFPFLLFFLLFLLLNFSACGNTKVLGLSRREAAELLQKKDTGFIFQADLPADFFQALSQLEQLSRIHPAAPFYAGLLIGAGDSGETKNSRSERELEMLLFSAALESSSLPARREAVKKLIPLILAGEDQGFDEAEEMLDFLNYVNLGENSEAALAALA